VPPTLAAGFLGIEHFTPPWDVFYLPLFNLLILAYRLLFNDFALAIIVFTVVIRTVLAPLFVQQIRSQKEMQRMQPLIREVQRKHKGNQQKITQETQALYREHGINPLGGCLPVILQLPILYALYQALIRASGVVQNFIPTDAQKAAFEALQSQHLIEPIANQANHYQIALSGPCNLEQFSQLPQFLPLNCQLIDPLHLSTAVNTKVAWLFNLDLAQIDHTLAVMVPGVGFWISALAVIAGILQFVQVKMTSPRPNPDDPTSGATSTMTYLFPVLTIVWGGLFASGLILYWVVYTAYLVVHQYLIMGWGNLFPIFGWSPPFGRHDAEVQMRASRVLPSDAAGSASAQSKPAPPGEQRPRQGPPAAQGQRGSTPPRPGARTGSQKKRGRKR
jgi:YidC/Oxa1 family membrane protein insertase